MMFFKFLINFCLLLFFLMTPLSVSAGAETISQDATFPDSITRFYNRRDSNISKWTEMGGYTVLNGLVTVNDIKKNLDIVKNKKDKSWNMMAFQDVGRVIVFFGDDPTSQTLHDFALAGASQVERPRIPNFDEWLNSEEERWAMDEYYYKYIWIKDPLLIDHNKEMPNYDLIKKINPNFSKICKYRISDLLMDDYAPLGCIDDVGAINFSVKKKWLGMGFLFHAILQEIAEH